jgi:hypothetical protein
MIAHKMIPFCQAKQGHFAPILDMLSSPPAYHISFFGPEDSLSRLSFYQLNYQIRIKNKPKTNSQPRGKKRHRSFHLWILPRHGRDLRNHVKIVDKTCEYWRCEPGCLFGGTPCGNVKEPICPQVPKNIRCGKGSIHEIVKTLEAPGKKPVNHHCRRHLRKYFDKVISKHAEPVYTMGQASGEAYIFSQIDRLVKLDNGLFEAKGTVYYTGSGETLDPHAAPEVWQNEGIDVGISMTFTALIKKINSDGKDRYILLQYAFKEQSGDITILINGDVVNVGIGSDRKTVADDLGMILSPEFKSVDTAERIQYDFPAMEDRAPVTVLFDFDADGMFTRAIPAADIKEDNPVAQDLVTWLENNVDEGREIDNTIVWHYAGLVLTLQEILDAGEDSIYQMTIEK